MIKFGLIWFYGISTLVCYVMQNPFYTYILDIYEGYLMPNLFYTYLYVCMYVCLK